MSRNYYSDFVFHNLPILILVTIITLPHIILCLILTFRYLIVCLQLFSFLKRDTAKSRCFPTLTKYMHQFLRMVLGKAFKPGSNDLEEDPKTVFYGYQVTNIVVYAFALIILEMFLVLAIIFWDKFLFEVSYGCPYNIYVPKLNCYNSTSYDPIDCSNSEELLYDQSIVCYRLIFDWSSAAGATGGTYVLLSFGITFMPRMMLKIAGSLKVNHPIQAIMAYYFLSILIMIIGNIYFFVYVLIYWNDGKYSLGEFFSTIGVLLILLTVSLMPFTLAKKEPIVHVNCDPNTNDINEATPLFTEHQT